MNWDKAFRKAAKAYFEGKGMKEYSQVRDKPMKYTKEYFDNIEAENLSKKELKMAEKEKGVTSNKPKKTKEVSSGYSKL